MVEELRLKRPIAAEFDIITKVMLIIFVTIASYFTFLLLLGSLFQGQPRSMYEMMQRMMYIDQYMVFVNLASLSLAVGVGLIFSLLLKTESGRKEELRIIKKALSENEKAVIDEVGRAGRITQDSLRFRLGWSKAKVSRILTNLDKMNLIQRERTSKTCIVFLSREEKQTV